MPFNHSEFFNRLIPHDEGYQRSNLSKVEEHWSKGILYGSQFNFIFQFYFLFFITFNRVFDFIKSSVGLRIPQSKLDKLYFINIRW